ncbi:T9SS type A sorting domain-containing protein [Reichenbachiella agarivorans]|uniref:T9SS type A sorting domain-containing protein n=1 Tax=Reichenbachiella agarivorans TaxID=2979464 RepID=A0ABY6CKS1_9BACT|nr:T9SS type A sorting domain-containing protein [Reichenbachiella agarivorans]UXP31119.1 T9SS type A sorting domain-containing protein [Reichenbachiella agarivorans]
MRKFLLGILLLIPIAMFAQTGPAGIGTTDGSSTLELWLRADQGISTIDNKVQTWQDLSGNSRHMTQPTIGNRPSFISASSELNEQAVVDFVSSSNSYLRGSNTADFFGLNTDAPDQIGDVFIVFKQPSTNSGYIAQFPRTTGNTSFLTLLSNGGNGTPADNNQLNDLQVFVSTNPGSFSVVSSEGPYTDNFTIDNFHLARYGFDPSTKEVWLYDNSKLIQQITSTNSISYNSNTGNNSFKLGSSGSGQYYDGEIAEVFVFTEKINDAKYIIIQNYLNARYNLPTVNDYYHGDEVANQNHDFGVFGIGRANATAIVNTANKEGLTLASNTGLEDGDYLFAGHRIKTNAILDNDINGITGSMPARMRRTWYLDKNDANNSLTVNITFDLDDAGLQDVSLATASNYRLITRATTGSGAWTEIVNTPVIDDVANTITFSNVTITDGNYYTVATNDNSVSPLGDIQQTWYSFQTGAWGNPSSWTLDGATTPIYSNPSGEIPGSGDNVIITAGRTISMYQLDGSTILNGVKTQSLSIKGSGRLNILTSTGHNMGIISGAGTLAIQGVPNTGATAYVENLPAGNYSAFADQLLGGTITLNTASSGTPLVLNQTLSGTITAGPNGAVSRSMTVNMTNVTDVVILQRALYLTNNLNITRGRLQIHRNAAQTFADITFTDTALSIDVINDVSISATGSIVTGTANQRHQFNSYGNFTNAGSLAFTQRVTPTYTSDATDGIVDLNFLNSVKDQTLNCNGLSHFYRIEVDKSSPTFVLTISASADGYFNLNGRANYHIDSDLGIGGANNNALGLVTGTVKLGTNVKIPVLNTANNYSVSSLSALWVDGGEVKKVNGTAVVAYGTVKISSGSAEFLVNSGITMRDAGAIEISGGTLYANQIRTSVNGANHVGSYLQTGGTVILNGGSGVGSVSTGSTGTQSNYYVFNLTHPTNVFRMSGGTLNIRRSNFNSTGADINIQTDDLGGGIYIASSAQNYEVTGGTVIMNMDNTVPFKVTSTAPFYNVIMTNSAGGAINDVDGNTTVNIQPTDDNIVFLSGGQSNNPAFSSLEAQPLVVLNDLTIGDGTNPIRFDHLGQNVTIGRNFTISANAQYYFGDAALLPISLPNGNATVPSTHQNTTTFNSGLSGTLNLSNLINDGEANNEQLFHNVIVNKGANASVTITAPNKISGNNNAFRIAELGSIRIESGTLDQGVNSLRFYGDVYNAGSMGVFESGVTENGALLKFRANDFTIETEPGAIFGNFRLNSANGTISLDNSVTIKRLQFQNGRLYIGKHNLKIEELDIALSGTADYESCQGCFSVEDMIITDGKVSDGGLSLRITSAVNPAGVVSNNINGNATLDAINDDYFLFPLGIGTTGLAATSKYTPALLSMSNVGDLGEDGEAYITINPVQGELQTTNLSGGEILSYYWKVKTEGFDVDPTLNFIQFFGNDMDDPSAGANLTSYVSGKVLDGGSYTRSSEANTVTDPANPGFQNTDFSILFDGDGAGFTLNNSNFTAGVATRFVGSPDIYYTKLNSRRNWNDQTKWTHNADGTAGGNDGYPQVGDIAVIQSYGNLNQNHWVNANVDIEIAELRFDASDGGYPPRLWVTKTNANLNLGVVSGEGEIYLEVTSTNSPQFIGETDLVAWSDEPNSTFIYQVTSNNNTVNMMSNVEVYPRLRMEAEGGTNRVLQTSIPITINQDVRMDRGANWRLNHDTHIKGDLRITWQDNSGCWVEIGDDREVTITMDSDLKLENGNGAGTANFIVENNNLNGFQHKILLAGNIEIETGLSGTSSLNLYNGTGTNNNAILELTGSDSKTFINYSSASVTPNLYRIVMNKGTDKTGSFAINNAIDIPLPSEIGEQPIEIVNGTLILDNSGIDITLTDASTGDFYLPNTNNANSSSGSGALEIKQGIARIEGDNTGLILDGSLILSGGNLDMSTGIGNGNNFIEYSANGNAQIMVTDAASTLSVGSQIRRGFFSDAGSLDLTITDGTVEIGAATDGDKRRGMLEIINSGSNFVHTGGSLIFKNQNGVTATDGIKASLLLQPDTYDLTGSTIYIDLNETNDDNFSINSSIPLNNLNILSTSGVESEVVQLKTRSLIINGDLTLSNDIEFRSNNLDLTLKGDLIINNTAKYTPGLNKTTFNIADATSQQVSSTSAVKFYNFEKTGTGTLNLMSDIEVSGATMLLSAGILADNGNMINFSGQTLVNNATHTSNGTVVNGGVIFNRTIGSQVLSTSNVGVFGNLTIDNSDGVALPDANQEFNINNNLTLSEGVLDIGPALLLLTSSATITNGNGEGSALSHFGEENQIQTNSSIIDFGLEKEFAANSTADIVFPVGEGNRYTPVLVDFTSRGGNSGSTAGRLRIRPRNAVAPIMLSEDQAIQDAILQYHWLINGTGLTNFDADVVASYDDDVIGTDAEDTYRAARAIFSDPNLAVQNPFPDTDGDGMIESDPDPDNTMDIVINTITFPIVSESDFSGEYFAGNPDIIPDAFETLIFDANSNNNYNTADNYFYDNNDDGVFNGADGDVRQTDLTAVTGGAIEIAAGKTMSLNTNYISFSRLIIPSDGVLEIDGTNGHILGQVSGTGTIRINSDGTTAALPAGDYLNFFDCTGGALEYGGSGDYTIMVEANEVRQLTLNGSGTKTFVTNSNISICEDLIVNDGILNLAAERTFTVGGDFIQNNGTVNMAEDGIFRVEGNVSLIDGVLTTANNSQFELFGDLSRTNTTISSSGGNAGQVSFLGNTSQNISGGFNMANVVINNSAPGIAINISSTLQINNSLSLIDGIIGTDNTVFKSTSFTINSVLIFGPSATYIGGSSASFVDGVVRKNSIPSGGNFIFPTGDGSTFAPVTVQAVSPGAADWTARYVMINPSANLSNNYSNLGTTTVSYAEYWVIHPSTAQAATVGLTYGTQSQVLIPNQTTVVSIFDNDGQADGVDNDDTWADRGRTGLSSGASTSGGTITSGALSSFNLLFLTIGGQNEDALPVDLLSFDGYMVSTGVELKWVTASEQNNDHFEIERSKDGENYEYLGQVEGNGTTSNKTTYGFIDTTPYYGVSYYRLIQVDYDGKETIFGPVTINNDQYKQGIEVVLYPNPTQSDNVNINLSSGDENSPIGIVIFDITGHMVYSQMVEAQLGTQSIPVRFNSRLQSGIYHVKVQQGNQQQIQKLVIR